MVKKTVVITGGTRGIGMNITKSFLENGFNVFVGSRKSGNLKSFDPPPYFIQTDVRKEENVINLIKQAKLETGRLDVLINNAGYSAWRPIDQIDESFLYDIFSTNLMSAFRSCKAAIPNMGRGGSIINISSIAGKRGSANNTAYVATKFGMNGLTQALAKEVGPLGIRVNGICPVLVATEGLLDALKDKNSPAKGNGLSFIKKFAEDQSALLKLPTGEDVASMCMFLASEEATAITAQNINIDCGVFPQ